jgi:hypothetical protein
MKKIQGGACLGVFWFGAGLDGFVCSFLVVFGRS